MDPGSSLLYYYLTQHQWVGKRRGPHCTVISAESNLSAVKTHVHTSSRKPRLSMPKGKKKKNFYGVQQGRLKGVFASWSECQAQISGFPGAIFKGKTIVYRPVVLIPNPMQASRPSQRPRLLQTALTATKLISVPPYQVQARVQAQSARSVQRQRVMVRGTSPATTPTRTTLPRPAPLRLKPRTRTSANGAKRLGARVISARASGTPPRRGTS